MNSSQLFYEEAKNLKMEKGEEKTKNISSKKLHLDVCHYLSLTKYFDKEVS